jgi:selenocysteine lyase/cysteine desulfurase
LEFPSSNLPWINNNNKENIRFVKTRNLNKITIDDISELIEKTNSTNTKNFVRTIVTSHVQYSTGFKQDLSELSKLSKKYGIFLVINATQSLGSIDFSVKNLGIDFMCTNGHKWMLSSFGIGTIYIKNTYLKKPKEFRPSFFSQSGQKDRDLYSRNTRLSISHTATRFEIGSPNLPNIIALNASLKYLSQIGIRKIEERILKLTNYLIERLKSINIKILSPISDENSRSGIILFQSKHKKPIEVTRLLEKKYKVIVSARANGIRVSPHFYNNEDDIDKLIFALEKIS